MVTLIGQVLRRFVRRIGTGRAIVLTRLLQLPLVLALGLAERVVPLSRDVVLYGSPRDRFADNAAYTFLAACRRADGSRLFWVTGSRAVADRLREHGLPVVMRWSAHGIWLTVRARAMVVSGYRTDINTFLGQRAVLANLWHGIPFKRIERDVTTGPLAVLHRPRPRLSPVRLALRPSLAAPDHLLSPSRHVTESSMLTAFGVSADRCWEAGYPRNDHLAAETPVLASGALVANEELWRRLAGTLVVGYFPTWRDDGMSALDLGRLSLTDLADAAAQAGALLLFKPHFNDPSPRIDHPNIMVVAPDEDLHAYLAVCDLLITDYSSVALDFSISGRRIVYFTPDIEDYRRARGFYFAPESVFVGDVCSTAAELLDTVARWSPDGSVADDRYLDVRARFWEGNLAGAGERVAELIAGVVAGSPRSIAVNAASERIGVSGGQPMPRIDQRA